MAADSWPDIRFTLTSLKNVQWTGSDTFTANATGNLAIHGITKAVLLDMIGTFQNGDRNLAVSGSAKLKLSDFGMEAPGFLFVKMSNDVRIGFRIDGQAAGGE